MKESAHTGPSPWCPRPDWWHADTPGATEDEVTELVAAFTRALQPEIVIETGAGWGHTSAAIGRALDRNGHGHLWTIEIDPAQADTAAQRCRGLPVTVTCGDSLTWDPPSPADLAWIDSGIGIRQAEIARWRGRFSERAVIGVHDTGPQHPVLGLLEPLFAEGVLYGGFTLHTPRGVTFARVRGS